MFKVVQTNDGCTKMFVVPTSWETNGIVYWPEKMNSDQFNQIKKDPLSKPSNGWHPYRCKVKYTAETRKLAKAKMCPMFYPPEEKDEVNIIEATESLDYGNNCKNANESIQICEEEFIKNDTLFTPAQQQIQLPVVPNTTVVDQTTHDEHKSISDDTSTILKAILHKLNTLDGVVKQQKELHTTVKSFMNLCSNHISKKSETQTGNKTQYKCVLKTMTTVEEVEKFNEALGDPAVMEKALQECLLLWGPNTKESYGTLVYLLLDKLIPKRFLAHCFSWGGGSKIEKKTAFKQLTNIIQLFIKSINVTDKDYNETICLNYFRKNVFKNCAARAESKGLRATKQRMVPSRKRLLEQALYDNILEQSKRPSNVHEEEQSDICIKEEFDLDKCDWE